MNNDGQYILEAVLGVAMGFVDGLRVVSSLGQLEVLQERSERFMSKSSDNRSGLEKNY